MLEHNDKKQLKQKFEIAGHPVGAGAPCFIIAEVALAHDGSLGAAHAYIDVAARAGASAVKFQTHLADAESSDLETFRVRFSRQDVTRRDYWIRTAFTAEQWRGLADHSRERGLVFLSSPFSLEAAKLLDPLVPAWKISAGELHTGPLLDFVATTKKPVILSTGLASWKEIEGAVELVRRKCDEIVLLQCTTAYPCPPERLGLNVIRQLAERFGCPVGLSDHSGTVYAGLAAAILGANMIEVHIVLSKDCFGPDVMASLTPTDLGKLVEGVRFVETAFRSPVDKDVEACDQVHLKKLFSKSIFAAKEIPKGQVIQIEDLSMKKPGFGIPANEIARVVGRRTQRHVEENEMLGYGDFE